MNKIIKVLVPEYRKIHVEFDDGTEGIIKIEDDFVGVAQQLNAPGCFARAKIIDGGYAIGFDDCEYDICSSSIYAEIAPSLSKVTAM